MCERVRQRGFQLMQSGEEQAPPLLPFFLPSPLRQWPGLHTGKGSLLYSAVVQTLISRRNLTDTPRNGSSPVTRASLPGTSRTPHFLAYRDEHALAAEGCGGLWRGKTSGSHGGKGSTAGWTCSVLTAWVLISSCEIAL